MPEYLSISKTNPAFPNYLNFEYLRNIGIQHLQALSGQLWTDYNLHDPGVTILEVLCYAITDLGYRNNLDIQDLLALNLGDSTQKENNFFTPDQVLTCNPVTELDLRKRLIDIPGVRNAWIQKIAVYEPAIYIDEHNSRLQYTLPAKKTIETALRLHPRGLYTVYLDLDPERRTDACGQSYRSWSSILDQVKYVLCCYRNLCEDVHDIIILGEEEISLCTDIELEANADPENVLVEIYVRVQAFLAPRLQFYTLSELLAQGKSTADIFAGRPSTLAHPNTSSSDIPYESHGFIDTAELVALTLPEILYTSDLYQIIMDVPGVAAIRKLSIINYINGLPQSQGQPWYLYLTPKHRPVLGIDYSTVTFFKAGLPFKADADEVKRRYYEQQAAYIKSPRSPHELDLSVPQGRYSELAEHYSIHHDFPLTYGISEDGLPETASALRKAQAKQLKGYLILFDQLLANYFAQLAHVRDLFSWRQEEKRLPSTYFSQTLSNLPGVKEIIRNYRSCTGSDLPDANAVDEPTFTDYSVWLASISEDPTTYHDRRNRFLDHLLARFAETFTDYVLINYGIAGNRRKTDTDILNEKAQFLSEYPALSRDRFRAFNYCDCKEVWDTNNVAGFKKRVSRLLGIQDYERRSLNHYKVVSDSGSVVITLRGSKETPLLQSKQVYPTEAAAQAAHAEFLHHVLDRTHYKKLSYRYFYHYGWDVTDPLGETLLAYDRSFNNQAERNTALQPLLSNLEAALKNLAPNNLNEDSLPTYVQLEVEPDGYFRFRLNIPVPEEITHTFTGTNRYPNREDATTAVEVALKRILDSQAYQKTRIRRDDAAEREAGTAEIFTYYGYAVLDAAGNLIAESEERLPNSTQRDEALQRWFSTLNASPNEFTVEAATECFFFELKDKAGEQTLLRVIKGVKQSAEAEAQGAIVFDLGRTRNAYGLTAADGTFGFFLQQEPDIPNAYHPHTYATELERNLRLDALLYYLNRLTPQAEIYGETGTYRATLLNPDGNPLLITEHTYSTHAQAEAAYQRLLHFASDPVYFQIINDLESENPYTFTLVDRRGRTFATHPQSYPTACQRDLVIRSMINYVNLEIRRQLVNREDGFYYELIDQSDSPLLVGAIAYANADQAGAAFEQMLPLARLRRSYQLIDHAEGGCPYSFALYDQTTLLATHPAHYHTAAERDQALQALLNAVICATPNYRIEGSEGHFTYALIDSLAEAEEKPYLLVSAVTYSDPDTAQSAFTQMLSPAAEQTHYRLLDNLPAPHPYSFELLDHRGEVLAFHRTRDGNAIAYATTSERAAAMEKIIYYTAQGEIRYAILNEEGSFFAEVWNQQGELLWIGERTFPSKDAAATDAELIRTLAQHPERYQPVDQGVESCLHSFLLTDELSNAIATHPRFYETAAARDRQMQRLQLNFSRLEALVQISQQTIPGQNGQVHQVFVGEIPAAIFCRLHDCTESQQQAFQTGAILRSIMPQTSFPTAEDAKVEFLRRLTNACDRTNFLREYHNHACYFTFKLQDPVTKVTLADSPNQYLQRAEMEAVIGVIQQISQGFTFTHTTPGTCCGYYFALELPNIEETATPAWLRSLKRYPTADRAWLAAAEFAENLRYLSRYHSPAEDAEGQQYGLGIVDQEGMLIAATVAQRSPIETFISLNSVGSFLQIEPQEGNPSGYRFRLVDRSEGTLLVSTQIYQSETEVREHFNRDVLSILLEPAAIERTSINGGQPYGFRIRRLPSTPDTEAEILALHPQTYPTQAQQEAAITRLYLLVRTAGLTVNFTTQSPAYLGQIYDTAGQILLQGTQRHNTEEDAWQQGNSLMELAQNDNNYRRIDDDEGTCTYSWELTNEGKDQILATPVQNYSNPTKRDQAIAAMQKLINDEGFHLLEHILLRPKQQPPELMDGFEAEDIVSESLNPNNVDKSASIFNITHKVPEQLKAQPEADNFLPIVIDPTDITIKAGEKPCLTCRDPYSFWVSIILPYWPERFRDINFRRFVERTLRLEAPAHVALKICWVNVHHMQEFETAYRDFIEQLALDACQDAACNLSGALNRLLAILPQLRSVYPEATLHSCEESGPEDNPIILNQTVLGTAND